jgi:hypothetical protein
MPWRGGTREWSNAYHFNGGVPADAAHWTTFADAVVANEKSGMFTDLSIVRVRGFLADSSVAIFEKDYSEAGTYNPSTREKVPGECAVLARWSTPAKTSKNHPIYLFNYYHGGRRTQGGSGDGVDGSWKADFHNVLQAWITGFSDGTNTYVRAGPRGVTAGSVLVEDWFTHRDFPR